MPCTLLGMKTLSSPRVFALLALVAFGAFAARSTLLSAASPVRAAPTLATDGVAINADGLRGIVYSLAPKIDAGVTTLTAVVTPYCYRANLAAGGSNGWIPMTQLSQTLDASTTLTEATTTISQPIDCERIYFSTVTTPTADGGAGGNALPAYLNATAIY